MAISDTDVVTLGVTLTTADGTVHTVVGAQLYYGHARKAVLAALDSVSTDVAATTRQRLEAANASMIEAAQAPIETAQSDALAAFSDMEA